MVLFRKKKNQTNNNNQNILKRDKQEEVIEKMEIQIEQCERNIQKLYAGLGKLYYEKIMSQGEETDEIYQPFFLKIANEMQQINCNRNEINRLRNRRICCRCGSELEDDAVFCTECGTKIQNSNEKSMICPSMEP